MPYPVGEAILATLGLLVSIGLGNPGCLLRFRSVLGKAPRVLQDKSCQNTVSGTAWHPKSVTR